MNTHRKPVSKDNVANSIVLATIFAFSLSGISIAAAHAVTPTQQANAAVQVMAPIVVSASRMSVALMPTQVVTAKRLSEQSVVASGNEAVSAASVL